MNQTEKKQMRKKLLPETLLLILAGLVMLSSFFLPYATASKEYRDALNAPSEILHQYNQLLSAYNLTLPDGQNAVPDIDLENISMFTYTKLMHDIWKTFMDFDWEDILEWASYWVILCFPVLVVVFAALIILNAIWIKPFWVLFWNAASFGIFSLWCTFFLWTEAAPETIYVPGISARLLPGSLTIVVIVGLWTLIRKKIVKKRIKANRAIEPTQ